MSETRERPLDGAGGLVEQTLAALDRPAVVCDVDGQVCGWNDALIEDTAVEASVAGAAVESVVDCEGDPLARALDAGEAATGSGTVAAEGGAVSCPVTCRPLERDGGVVGAVVTLDIDDRDAGQSSPSGSVAAAGVDGDERVETERELVEADRRLNLALRNTDAGVFEWWLDDDVVYWHDSLSELYDFDSDRNYYTSEVFRDLLHPDDREKHRRAREEAIEGNGEFEIECRIEHPEKGLRWLEIEGEVVYDDDGHPERIVGVDRDVTDRKERERELERLMRRAELAMDATDTGVWERDLETGEVDWDSASRRLYGYEPGAFPETYEAFTERVREEDLPRVRRQTERAIEEEGVAEAEFRIQPPDGPQRWIMSRGLVEDDDPTRMVGIHADITDRKEREHELESLNARLQLALEGTNTGVWEWNVETDEVILDEQMKRLFCFDPGEFENDYDRAIARVHPEDVEDMEAALERGIEEGSYETEFRVHVDGTTERWVRARAETYYEDGEPARMVGICTDVTEHKERERELRRERKRFEKLLETSPVGITTVDSDGQIVLANERAEDVLGLSCSEITDRTYDDPDWRIVDEDGDPVPSEQLPFSRVMETGEPVFEYEHGIEWPDGAERWLSINMAPLRRGGEIERVISVITDVTERRRQQERLETLSRIQQLIHESVGALAAATTQEEVKTTVCERLAGSPFYEFAWIGERDPASREICPQCWDGIAGDYLDEITVTVDSSETGRGPGGRAYRSGEVAVVSDVDADPEFAPWREPAAERGFRSVAAVPLTHGSTTHGVLVVYADRPEAFDERELAGFEALGGTVGFALSAAQNRRLLESETVLRLEFLAKPEEPAFRAATVDHGCRLVFDGVVGTGDGKTLCYLTVEDADPGVVEPAAEAASRVERATRLEGEGGPHFELVVANSTFQLLADAGARGTRIVVEDGHSRVVVEAPTDVDVRRVREALEGNYVEVAFQSRTEVEPTEMEWLPTEEDVGARLTDRQRSVLRVAYYSGYYDWPRKTDAEGLADSFDLATPTVLQHLRRGHRRVMTDLFDA